jgi:pyruvate kinase
VRARQRDRDHLLGTDVDPASLTRLLGDVEELRARIEGFERSHGLTISEVHPAYEASARNLVHYLALRAFDLKDLSERLSEVGFSSLGRSESHVMASLNAVLRLLHRATGNTGRPANPLGRALRFREGQAVLDVHTEALLGPRRKSRSVRILVTLPGEAADDYPLIRDLLHTGMDCARINCAHDTPEVWARLVANVRRASRELAMPCRVLMDLGGPKLRTGELEPGPKVVKLRPRRDAQGRVLAPAQAWLCPDDSDPNPQEGGTRLPVPRVWLEKLRVGDVVGVEDLRGKSRQLVVVECTPDGARVEAGQTLYLVPGLELEHRRGDQEAPGDCTRLGDLAPVPVPIVLHYGEHLVLTADPAPGHPAVRDALGEVTAPARVPCTLPEVLADLQAGERVWLDDGKIGAVVRQASPTEARLEIVRARPDGSKLLADKGINLPDSRLRIQGLTAVDREDLRFVASCADMVALSFLRGPEDVVELRDALRTLGGSGLGIVLKIETRQALEHLPAVLLAAMRGYPVGVMIARGDLAVECGFERLAEAQEEILWVCEAAHVPVIWATQVLENLTKQGLPSRAEVTDAAASVRAECVMLNKGPFVLDSVRVLDDILERVEGQQEHRKPLFVGLEKAP